MKKQDIVQQEIERLVKKYPWPDSKEFSEDVLTSIKNKKRRLIDKYFKN